MSDDEEPDLELLELLRQSLGIGASVPRPAETNVLDGAEYVYDNSIDVALDSSSTRNAAEALWELMQDRKYSAKSWTAHELHPKVKDESTVDFIFTMDLLNFSFWSELDSEHRYTVEYRGRRWTGYWSMVAALRRALDEGIPITRPDFWQNEAECTEEIMKHIFRSATDETIPLFPERLACLREAGSVLYQDFDGRFSSCIREANKSAAALVNLIVEKFSCFHDDIRFEGRNIRFLKRAQILVADLWACFDGESYGEFHDIDKITMFADYRIPQMLHSLGCLVYSPPLENHIRQLKSLAVGHHWEIQLRGCSIWCVELIRQTILRKHPEAKVNAILIDFFLYDTIKEREEAGLEVLPHHRTRSIRY